MQTQKHLMTSGSISKLLLRFSFPLFLGALFQQLYNAVDSWVVGQFCGDEALAAVSSSGSLCFLLIGFCQGVFLGGGVVISSRYGARDQKGVEKSVHTLVVFALLMGVLLTVGGVLFTPTILRWMGTPENVLPQSIAYFRIFCGGLMALVLYNAAVGIFQALGDTKRPLIYLLIAAIANAVLDFLFVAGLNWGVSGAALATVLGQALSAVLAFAHLMRKDAIVQIQIKKLVPDLKLLKKILQFGLPSGFQNSVIAIANVVVQSNINAFGDAAMAGCGSYSKIEAFVFLPIQSITMAITTFIGQNLGAGNIPRAKKGGKIGTLMVVAASEIIGLFVFFLAPQLIGIFSKTPEVLQYGVQQAHVEALFYCFLGYSHGCASILRGTGRSMTPMMVMLSVWCVFRILYITVFVHFVPNILVLFTAYPVTWFLSSVCLLIAVKKLDWEHDKLSTKKA